MLSTYVAALTRAGLVVDQLREPQQFDRQPVWREVPQLLYVRSYRSTQFSSDTGSGGGRE
ncbi:hypothetical protein [Kribbella qitaiheensis]|nr:hypothetical protein [Kribbella qitaiheensis]